MINGIIVIKNKIIITVIIVIIIIYFYCPFLYLYTIIKILKGDQLKVTGLPGFICGRYGRNKARSTRSD